MDNQTQVILSQNHKLVCPDCHSDITETGSAFFCASCRKKYPIIDNIPDFRKNDEYWCNVSRDKMRLLNRQARETNDWQSAAKSVVPEYIGHFMSFNRADAQFLFPITKDAQILDAGSMWGGLTLPVAQYAREVIALDKTIETLTFLNIRAAQMGYKNIFTIASTLEKLPFSDSYFDMAILNGVLEWVAFRQDLILERHWNQKFNSSRSYAKNPTSMQIEVLKELRRVLKPDGYLFLAIENRIGYQYLTGYPDDHVNIRLVPFLPRMLSDIITRLKRGFSYRTYIYSHIGCSNILLKSGYKKIKFFGAFSHYISPYAVIPFSLIKRFKETIYSGGGKRLKTFFKLLPNFIMKYFSPSFIIIAGKSGTASMESRIISMVRKTGVLKNSAQRLEPILISRRADTAIPLKCIIYDSLERRSVLFCKICRDKSYTHPLRQEAQNLTYANKQFKNTPLEAKIPHLLYFGVVDGVQILITNFLNYGSPDIKNNCAVLDKAVGTSIDFLVEFQNRSVTREVEVSGYLTLMITQQKKALERKLDSVTLGKISELADTIAGLRGVKLKLAAVHGDFDFYHNILYSNNDINVVDFEHFEKEGIPFSDLAMLILHPFLLEYKNGVKKENFTSYLKRTGAVKFLRKWLRYYFLKSNIDKKLFPYAVKIAILEQNAKEYPLHRDRKSFPLNDADIVSQIFSGNLDFKE